MLIKRGRWPVMLVIMMVLAGCNHPDDPVLNRAYSNRQFEAVLLAPREFRRSGIAFENILEKVTPMVVPCTGYLVTEPGYETSIPSPADGRITALYRPLGQYIKAGATIALLENIDFVKLQQEYLEARYLFDYCKEEFTRQGELTVENATSIKKMQIAKRDYQSAEVTLHTLRSQLENLGICPDSVKPEKMSPVIRVIADGSGYLSGMEINVGTYVNKGQPLFELVNTQALSLKLQVNERHIGSLKPGQMVNFHLSFDSLSQYRAKLSSVIKAIDPAQHTAIVYAEPSGHHEAFMPGLSVKATIEIGQDTIWMINPQAIRHDPKGDFTFVKKDGYYLKIPVRQGITRDGKTEIIGLPPQLADSVVVSGLEYLVTQFK